MKNHIETTTEPAPDGGLLVREKWPGGGRTYSISKEQVDSWKKAHDMLLSRQEQAYEYVTETFLKLLQRDKRIGAEHKKSVLAFYEDMFEHEGVRNNMIQAFSNFLGEIDKRMDASRKAGIVQVREAIEQAFQSKPGSQVIHQELLFDIIDQQIELESKPEHEEVTNVEDIDLSEVGGGDEDDTPLI